MRVAGVLGALAALTACAGDTDCSELWQLQPGTWQGNFVQVSGDCGASGNNSPWTFQTDPYTVEEPRMGGGATQPPAGCTQTAPEANQACVVEFSRTCPIEYVGLEQPGRVELDFEFEPPIANGTQVSGTVAIEEYLPDGTLNCFAVSQVTETRIGE
jgi:hypothetical protein